MPHRLRELGQVFAIARLDAFVALPDWATCGDLAFTARTPREVSILVEASCVPGDVRCERDWLGFVILGPLPFTMTGVLASILQPLADAGIPILAMSTFDTDYVFVQRAHRGQAIDALVSAGHEVIAAPPST
jgi:hypothetical protein